MAEIELIQRASKHGSAIAIRTNSTEQSYAELLDRSQGVANALLNNSDDLSEARVAYLVPAGFNYITVQWGIWRAGGIAVPLSMSATQPELEYTLRDSEVEIVVVDRDHLEKLEQLCVGMGIRLLALDDLAVTPQSIRHLPTVTSDRRAMILYTSGTTSKPKGVVTTHANIQAQIETLVEAWSWDAEDSIPLFLPLHHIHGIINVMSCALWSGATIEPFTRFDMEAVLGRVSQGAYSVFMAVPTIYVKLIHCLNDLPESERAEIVSGFARMRLMISGSAALPASVHEAWTGLTGQKLLERYGMTEIGMGLSNPYDGERRPGAVGQPLPGVHIRLLSEAGDVIEGDDQNGEIQVRGPSVFLEYWKRPEITKESFDQGWFRTGDMAVVEDGYYRIMGRQSVDIIKSGGYKLSALEIEASLLDHPAIVECAVVGAPDETWGEAVAVAVVVAKGAEIDLETLRSWCANRLSKYKTPKRLLVVDGLPRNAMGKVKKPAVLELFA